MGTIRIESRCGGTNKVSVVNKETGEEHSVVYLKPYKQRTSGNVVDIRESSEFSAYGGDSFIKVEFLSPEEVPEEA